MKLIQAVTHNLLNIPGWNTNRHIVVVESDDWGAIRMPSKEVYEKLLHAGYRVDKNRYESNDSLERGDDLSALFDVLLKYKDKNGSHPIITANCAVANPDFDRIKADNYQNYYYEPFTETYKRYKGCEQSLILWHQGMKEKLFMPQFHAREHLNVAKWIHDLQANDESARYVFGYGIMGLFQKWQQENLYQVAFDDSQYKLQPLNEIVSEGMELFKQIFNINSKTFIAPCYTWRPELEKTLFEKGVLGIQGMVYQRTPGGKSIRHFMGTQNQYGQVYTIRNCSFEPTLGFGKDYCLDRMKYAFRWRKPAIISSHRINYIGAINEKNRSNNLRQLSDLFSEVLKRWPDVEFMSSNQLVELVLKK
jgi:hypothetical protein